MRRALAVGLVWLVGCVASTRLTDVWRDPKYTAGPLHSFLVFAQSRDPTNRRLYEDAYVGQLRAAGVQAQASYELLPQDRPEDAAVHEAVSRSGADGLLLVQVVAVDQQLNEGPSAFFAADPFFPTYGAGFGVALGPAYTTDTIVRLSSRVYRANDGAGLVFAALSRTLDPHSARSLASEVAAHVVEAARLNGVL